jgi:hypothetical protein
MVSTVVKGNIRKKLMAQKLKRVVKRRARVNLFEFNWAPLKKVFCDRIGDFVRPRDFIEEFLYSIKIFNSIAENFFQWGPSKQILRILPSTRSPRYFSNTAKAKLVKISMVPKFTFEYFLNESCNLWLVILILEVLSLFFELRISDVD